MNYYDARQKGEGGGWHYTCMNDGRIWAVGTCAEHEPDATRDEAYECYSRYLLDEHLKLDGRYADARYRCQLPDGCEEWTDRYAQVGAATSWHLCDEHRTRDVVARLLGTVGAITSSW